MAQIYTRDASRSRSLSQTTYCSLDYGATFQSLPVEIILEIYENSESSEDLVSLTSTCKRFHEIWKLYCKTIMKNLLFKLMPHITTCLEDAIDLVTAQMNADEDRENHRVWDSASQDMAVLRLLEANARKAESLCQVIRYTDGRLGRTLVSTFGAVEDWSVFGKPRRLKTHERKRIFHAYYWIKCYAVNWVHSKARPDSESGKEWREWARASRASLTPRERSLMAHVVWSIRLNKP